eukprot:4363742-Pyramimonas_sp.AAC.1
MEVHSWCLRWEISEQDAESWCPRLVIDLSIWSILSSEGKSRSGLSADGVLDKGASSVLGDVGASSPGPKRPAC